MSENLKQNDEKERERDLAIIGSLNDLKQVEFDLLEKWRSEGGLDPVHTAELNSIQNKMVELEAFQKR